MFGMFRAGGKFNKYVKRTFKNIPTNNMYSGIKKIYFYFCYYLQTVLFQMINNECVPEKVCFLCIKQLEEINLFIEKCKVNYSLLIQLLCMKPEGNDDKENNYNNDNEGSHEDSSHEVSEKSQFQCGKCDETFCLKKQLSLHMKAHSETRPYRCVTCGLTFRYKQNFLQHNLLHTNITLYKCHICGKGK